MRTRRAVAAISAAMLLASCGVPDQSSPDIISGSRPAARPSPVSHLPTPTSAELKVYFVDSSNRVVPVTRPNPVGGLATAITTLLAGPTSEENTAGLSSAIPVGTTLTSVHQTGSTAALDFSDALASVTGREQLLAFAQIVVTADSLPDVDRVQISIAGQEVNAPEPNGTLAQGPVTKNDYASLVGP